MARGTSGSFSDGLQGLLGQIGQLLAAPDADLDFIMQLRQMVMDRLSGHVAEQMGAEASSQSPAGMPPGGMAGEMPRGPMPSPDLGAMAQAGAPPA